MRALFLLLALANIAFFAWYRYLSPPEVVSDPAPMARQIDPEKVKVIPEAELPPPRARATRTGASGPSS